MKRFAYLSMSALLVGMIATVAQASTISWGAATTMVDETDVVTTGTDISHAYGISAVTLNGVAFTTGWTKAELGSLSATCGQDVFTVDGVHINISAPNTFLPSPATNQYDTLTGGAIYKDSKGTVTYTIGGLTSGRDYLVQIWARDARYFSGYTENCMVTVDGTITLDYNVTNAANGMGQYTVGTFRADGATQTFTLVGASCPVQLNGIQVRDVTVPEPSTIALLATGLLGLIAYAWRKRK